MRKMLQEFANSIRKAVSKVAHWVKAGASFLWNKAVKPVARFTVMMVAIPVGGALILATVAASAVLLVLDIANHLITKGFSIAVVIVMIPLLAFFGRQPVMAALRALWALLTVWKVTTISGELTEPAYVVDSQGEIEVVIESVPASQKKGRPTPKQRKHRPARPAGIAAAPVAV